MSAHHPLVNINVLIQLEVLSVHAIQGIHWTAIEEIAQVCVDVIDMILCTYSTYRYE